MGEGDEIKAGRRTCCDKLAIDRVLLLSIPDSAEILLSPVWHGVLALSSEVCTTY